MNESWDGRPSSSSLATSYRGRIVLWRVTGGLERADLEIGFRGDAAPYAAHLHHLIMLTSAGLGRCCDLVRGRRTCGLMDGSGAQDRGSRELSFKGGVAQTGAGAWTVPPLHPHS